MPLLQSDEKALRTALGDDSIKRQPRKIKAEGYPELYAAIVQVADLSQLDHRCPGGFLPFHQQITELIDSA